MSTEVVDSGLRVLALENWLVDSDHNKPHAAVVYAEIGEPESIRRSIAPNKSLRFTGFEM
jgi:hypothetical protein